MRIHPTNRGIYFPALMLLLMILATTACKRGDKTMMKPGKCTAFVNPFIGTDSDGHTFPGAVAPFGMVQLSPDTRVSGPDYASGYHYSDSTIMGFSHTRYSGTGRGAGGDVMFMPFTGAIHFDAGKPEDPSTGYRSRFSHKNETASPGYYKVLLDDYQVTVELTAGKRTGFHKYTFEQADTANILLDLTHGINDKPDSLYLKISGNNKIEGYRKSLGGLRDYQKLYFTAEFSGPFDMAGIFHKGKVFYDIKEAAGNDLKALFRFAGKKEIMVKVALSKVSIAGAKKNIREIPGWDFDAARENAQKEWDRELGKIEVSGGNDRLKTIFYTALYHACIMPSLDMDMDGQYRSTNNKVYTADGFTDYTNFSLWDTFRALHPLHTIINRAKSLDFIKTFLERYKHSGSMPIFELSGNDLLVMIGYHSLPVIADAYVKGIGNFDTDKAVEGMKSLANMPFEERNEYRTFGYIPYDYTSQSVSRTLEYAFDDWCVAQVARDRDGKTYHHFMNRANLYRNLFDKESGFMRPRDSHRRWLPAFDPLENSRNYTQGNAWQYTTFVPQNIRGLIELMGGDKHFETWLDRFFSVQGGKTYQGRSSSRMIGQYYHGNEPSHHIAYLYNYAGAAPKTQRMVRKIMSSQYAPTPDGLAGNDDAGQMSAWYVLSAMGFYSVTPGMDYYVIGSPQFDRVSIHMENGRTFTIIAKNNGPGHIYIRSAILNGKPYTKSYLKHRDIIKGGTMIFEMADKPNPEWGQKSEDRPYSIQYQDVDMPEVLTKGNTIGRDGVVTFDKACDVTVRCNTPGADIFCTTDGSEPDAGAMKYTRGFTIGNSCVLKTRTFKEGFQPGYTSVLKFRELTPVPSIRLKNPSGGIRFDYREVWICKTTRQIDQYPILKTGILSRITSDPGFVTASNYSLVYTGYIKVPENGTYTFYVDTEYAAALWIDDILIASNESTDWLGERYGKISLQKGFHKIITKYFQVGGKTELKLWWNRPGAGKQEIPASAWFHEVEQPLN